MAWKRFEDIEIWQEARLICQEVHAIVKRMDTPIYWGLGRQMIDSSGSVMDNIAEGFERGSNHEFKTFLGYARGSNGELRSQLYRCHDFEIIHPDQFHSLNARLIVQSKRNMTLMKSVSKNSQRGFRLNS